MQTGAINIPTMMHMQTMNQRSIAPKKPRKSSKHSHSKYGSLIYESSSVPRNTGEYSYGKGGMSFGKTIKRSKFDEDKDRVYSPGPGRYQPRTADTSAVFSFGKQKKDFSFVQNHSREVPSPGKYKIKRDFLSNGGKNKG